MQPFLEVGGRVENPIKVQLVLGWCHMSIETIQRLKLNTRLWTIHSLHT